MGRLSEAGVGVPSGAPRGGVASGDEAVITTAPADYTFELRGLYLLHARLAESLGLVQDEYFVFPQTLWQVTAVETTPFRQLDQKYGENAWWGVIDFAEQQGGGFAFLDHQAVALVTGIGEEDLADEAGAQQVEQWFLHLGACFQDAWAEAAGFDVQIFPSPSAPPMSDLQGMFPGLNMNTPVVTTAFRVVQPGQPYTARVVVGIPQAFLLALGQSLQSLGEVTYGVHDTTHFYERFSHIEEVPVPVSVQLGTVALTVGELQSIEPGDVLELPAALGEPLTVKVGSLELRGRPGTTQDGKRLAVQITGASG
ncbi:MAG: FliM/FliN family flagellar motor switch protein [Candidatus Sericytochromatia bacterium]|nr:FliM/FliN family flagellar motor switch protein [Candidatus Sericytochromatia bacterium]